LPEVIFIVKFTCVMWSVILLVRSQWIVNCAAL